MSPHETKAREFLRDNGVTCQGDDLCDGQPIAAWANGAGAVA